MKKNRLIIFVVGFLFSIPLALTSYINSSFLEGYIGEYYIAPVYIFASLFVIFGLTKIPKLLTKFGNRKISLFFSLLGFIALLILAFSKGNFWAITGIVLYFISTDFLIASLDIFIEDFSKNKNIGKFRGLYLMIINTAWVLAQMVSGSIINKSSFHGIYLFSASFMALTTIIFFLFLKDFKDPKYTKVPILKTIKTFKKNKSLSRIYLINLILKFFFSWMVIYTPIYLYEHIGFNWEKIGFIFTIMLIPFVLLDYPLGKISDKIGEKKILSIGFIITAIFTFIIPFISTPEIWLWALVLFGTRVGAATIEIMSESYFFKEVTDKNADEISFFRNTYPISFILGPLIATPILFILPSFKYIFLVLVAIILMGLFITLKLKDIK